MAKSRGLLILIAAIAGSLGGVLAWHYGVEPMRRATAADEAIAMVKAQEKAWNTGDLPGFLSAYDMNEEITFYSNDTVTKGWVTINDHFTGSYGSKPNLMGKLAFTDLIPEAMNSDTVLIRGRWIVTESEKAGTGLFTILVKKTPTGWKVVHDHTSAKPKNP